VLAVAAADVVAPWVATVALLGALLLLAESFGRDVLWLWNRRLWISEGSDETGRAGVSGQTPERVP